VEPVGEPAVEPVGECAAPPLPIRAGATAPTVVDDHRPPLDVLRTAAAVPAATLEVRRLDRGRLSAGALVAMLAWAPRSALDVVAVVGPVVALVPDRRHAGWARSLATSCPHVDAQRRIVLPAGVRDLLGVRVDDAVVAWVADGVLAIASAGWIPAALGALAATFDTRPALIA